MLKTAAKVFTFVTVGMSLIYYMIDRPISMQTTIIGGILAALADATLTWLLNRNDKETEQE